jgi:putative glutamine amidotransferase
VRGSRSDRITVGVTASLGTVTAGAWTDPSAYSPRSYVDAVQRTGARAVLLVPDERDAEDPAAVFDVVDAVVLSGGAGDVDPARYGERCIPRRTPTSRCATRSSWRSSSHARPHGRAAAGYLQGHAGRQRRLRRSPRAAPARRRRARRPPGAARRLRRARGPARARVAGRARRRRRARDRPVAPPPGHRRRRDGLRPTGWAVEDDTVEAVESADGGFLLGVLWHPEEDERSRIIGALVDAARGAGR